MPIVLTTALVTIKILAFATEQGTGTSEGLTLNDLTLIPFLLINFPP